jgi:hypothetical protein
MVGLDLEHVSHLLAGAGGLAGTAIGPRKIDARVRELGCGPRDSLEYLDRCGRTALVEQCNAEQMQASHIPGPGGLDGAKLSLRRGGSAKAEHRQSFG